MIGPAEFHDLRLDLEDQLRRCGETASFLLASDGALFMAVQAQPAHSPGGEPRASLRHRGNRRAGLSVAARESGGSAGP